MIEPTDKLYAKKLRTLRLKKDFKQSTVAELLGLKSQQDYSKLEHGQKHFTNQLITDICRIFDFDRDEFTTEINDHKISKPDTTNNHLTELEQLKTILALKSEITDFEKLTKLVYNKLLIEKEIELIKLKINGITSKKYVFKDGMHYRLVEFF